MNNIRTKLITGTVAAALLIGGGSYMQTQAFAAAADTNNAITNSSAQASPSQTTADTPRMGRHHRVGHMMEGGISGSIDLIGETAALLKIEVSELMTKLHDGATLAEIAQSAGLSKADYISKLVAAGTTAIDEKLAAGSITQDQADAAKSSLTERLTKAIESDMPMHGGRGHGHGMKGMKGMKGFGSKEELAAIVGMTEDELKAALASGQSLADVAAAKGITEADLIAKIKASLDDELKTFVNEKRTAPAAASTPTASPAPETTASGQST